MEKINFYTQYSLNDTPELRMVIDVSGNVGIGESNPTKALEVAGDISFNGDLYQNGTLFVGGGGGLTDLSATSINDLSDVSLNGIQLNQTLKWDGEKLVPYTPGTTATSITKQGQVLETLAGVCDGRTVTVESGSYTLPNVTAYQDTTTSWTDVAGSSINYTPPSGTKQVIFEFHLSLSSNTDSKAIMLFKLLIDGISVTSQNQEWGDDTNTYGDNIFYRSIIDITGTNDVANGKLESWNSNKTIKLQVVNFSGFDGRLHANYFGGLSSNSSATHNLIKPRLKITSIGESSGQAVTLTNNSVSDLSDISFNSTSTTDGQALVWNSTDGVWEAGAVASSGGLTDLSATSINDLSDVSFNATTTTQGNSLIWNNTDKVWESGTPTTSIVNTTTTVTNSGGWVDKNPTNEPAYHGFGDLVYNGNDDIYFVGGWENGSTRRNYVWKYTISTNTWGQVTTTGTFVSAISSNSTVFYNNALYVFGGNDGSNLNTLYKLDLSQSTPTWSLISTSGTITARREQNAGMYNSKLIIFGGYTNTSVNDVYEIDLASQTPTWIQLHNGSGTAPSGRYANVFQIYQNKAIIFSGGGVADCWEFNLLNNTWNEVTMSGTIPSARSFVGDAMINTDIYVYGGYSGKKSDFYKLDVTTYTWTQITNNIVPGMEKHGATFANGKFYVYGNNGSTTGYTYEYTIPTTTTTYNPVEINKLSTYYALSIGPNYDTSNMDNSGNLIVEGNVGIGLSDPSGYKLEVAGDISFNGNLYQNGTLFVGGGGGLTDLSATSISDLSDVSFNATTTTQGNSLIWNNTDKVWESGTPTTSIVNTIDTQTNTPSWNQITTSGTVGTMTAYSDLLVYNDNGTDYLIFSTGWTGSVQSNKTYRYNISTSTWNELTTSNTLSARYGSTAVIYNNNYYLFGGRISANLNETWKLDLTTNTWSQLSTTGTAPVARRYTNSDIYNGNLIIFGGYSSNALNDVWKLNLTTLAWTQLHDGTGTAPSARYIHSVNITGDNLYVFGGIIPGSAYNDTWKFDLTTNTWTQLSTSGTTPVARRVMDAIIYNNNLYIFGGINGSGTYMNDIWELNLSTLIWSEIDDGTSPSVRVEFRLALYNDKMYLFGGNDDNVVLNDTWEFTLPQYTTNYNPVEINKLSTYYALSIGPNYDTSNMDNSGNLIVEGNVGIGLSDPSGYKLEVAGDISFNGNLYQNGALFTGGSTIDQTTDVSLNNLIVHGDISGSNDILLNGRITIAKEERDQTPVYDTEYQITFNGGNTYNNWILYNTSNSNSGNVPVNTDWTIEYSHKITIGNGENHSHFAIVLKEDGISSTDFGNNTYFMYYATFPNSLVFRYKPADSTNQTDSIPTFTWSSFSEFVDVKWEYTTSNNTMILYFNGNIVASISNLTNSSKIYGTWGFGEWNDNTHHLINPRITHGGTTYTITTVNSTSSTAPTVSTNTTNTTILYAMDVSGKAIFSDSVTANGSVLSSDDRIKHNEQPITNALSTISKITPKHYFKTGSTLYDTDHHFPLNDQNQPISASGTPLLLNKDYTIETGIIAQEIKAIPELSFTVQNTTPLGVDYNSIHCTHIAATKELHQLVQSQQTQIEEQQSEIEHLKMVNIDMNNQLATALQQLEHIKRYLAI